MRRGTDASTTPWSMPWAGWKQVIVRTGKEATRNNLGLVAAGVAFYAFLALVPLLGAIVLIYGLVAEPATVVRNLEQITSVLPADAARLVGEQLLNVVRTSDGKKGLGLLLALSLALFGARNGAGAIISALNIAYGEEEKRGFLRLTLVAMAVTVGAAILAIVAVIAISVLGYLENLHTGTPMIVAVAGKIFSYLLLFVVGAAGAATLYRYAPSRGKAKWVWFSPGSVFSAVLWLLLTAGFGIYVAQFGNYNAVYGSLSAVVVLLTWLYLSSYILLVGAELNSVLERHIAANTIACTAHLLGQRSAWVADHVANDLED